MGNKTAAKSGDAAARKGSPPRFTYEETEQAPLSNRDSRGMAKIPVPARILETGEMIQTNCCLTPWCSNFGVPVGKDAVESYGFFLAPRERQKVFGPISVVARVSRTFECKRCGSRRDLLSNRGVSEMAGAMIAKYAPALHCPKCTGNDSLPAGAYPWSFYDFASPVRADFGSAGRKEGSGNSRFRCQQALSHVSGEKKPKQCSNLLFATHRSFPQEIRQLFENPDNHVQDLHDSSFMTANQYRRSVALRTGAAEQARVRMKPLAYYKALNWYHFLAVEWLGYFNNQIRASAATVIGAVSWEKQQEKWRQTARPKRPEKAPSAGDEPVGNDEGGDDDSGVETSEERESLKQTGKMDSFCDLPHVQSDTLELSVATPGQRDKHQEILLTISVLAPAGYILLVTTNCVDGPDVNELLRIDRLTEGMYWAHDPELKDREFVMHPHLQRLNDAHTDSNRPFLKGTTVTPNFAGEATRVRKVYHAFGHYYALEKILRGIRGEILLSLDGDKENIRACLWAFRERVKGGKCHIVRVSPVQDGGAVSRGDGVTAEMAKLKKEVGERKQAISRILREMSATNKTLRSRARGAIKTASEFKSSDFPMLAQRWNSESALHKNKIWLTTNSFLGKTPNQAAKILRTATLFDVDSVCNQMRQRIPGFFRGKLGAKRDSHSYVTHSRNPLILQRRADIFAFSKNCLAWHSLGKGYRPAISRLGMRLPGAKLGGHLVHYSRMFWQSLWFVNGKFNLGKPNWEKEGKS